MEFPVSSRQSEGTQESATLMIFGFLEDSEESSGSSYDSGGVDLDFEEDENPINLEEYKSFWESQDQLLQATLCRTSTIESKIRQATKKALRELNLAGVSCDCGKQLSEGCRSCTQRQVSDRLRSGGYNCAVCKSKWMTSKDKDIPSGEHTYIEVLHNSNTKKGETKVVIELTLRSEFQMARASDEYNKLTSQLPEVFIGKVERLRAVVKLLCSAFKRCMKERKMHIAPWRKQKYMQAKWLGTPEMSAPPLMMAVVERSERLPSARHCASMLTFDLVANVKGLQFMAIQIV